MATKLTKKDLIRSIADEQGRTHEGVSATLDALLDQITKAVESGQEVSLHGFGNFKRLDRKARQGRNPRTGEPVQIDASSSLGFRPAKALKDRLNA